MLEYSNFSAAAGKGAFCNGDKIYASQTDKVEQALLVTGFGYEHDEAWATNIELFKEFTDVSRGVRRLGAASVDMCHVALGIVEAYWEYRLKPWDMAAGVLIMSNVIIKSPMHRAVTNSVRASYVLCSDPELEIGPVNELVDDTRSRLYKKIVEEAGGTVSCMDGCNFSVFDRSVLVSNGILHAKLLERIGPATEKLKIKGIDFSLWYKPENYCTQP